MKYAQLIGIISGSLMLLVGASACSVLGGQGNNTQPQAPAVYGDLTLKVNGSGKTVIDQDARLSFGVAGKVEEVKVKKGNTIAKGDLIARLNTDALELALSQAKVAEAQSQVSITAAQLAQAQAEASILAAQIVLDKTQAVRDIKDKITSLEWEIKIAETQMKEAQNNNNEGGAGYYRQLIANDRTEQANQQKKLSDLLSKSEYDGTITYDVMGDKYGRITVEDMKAKQLTLEAAQKTAEQARQSVEQATRGLEQSKKAIIVAQDQLKDATITAPFNGLISSVDVKQGDFIAPLGSTTGTLVYMVDPNSLELNVEIDEIDVPGVKVGQKAIISLDALPEVKFEGKVTNVSMLPVVKPQNSGVVVYEVKVVFDGKPPAEVKSGMSASVDILTGVRQNVLLIPNKSIKRDSQGKPVVQVLEKDKVTEKAVVLGKSDGVQTEVLKGLQSGEIIILTQQKAGLATAKS